jgi:peroxiredoxin
LREAGYAIVGVSADTQERNDAFAKSLGLDYPLVGDPRGEILRAYGARWPVLGLARRVSYVIGSDGRVMSAFQSERDPEAHVQEACRVIPSSTRG